MSMEAVLAPYLTSQWGKRAVFGAIGLASLLLLITLIQGIHGLVTLSSSHTQTTAPIKVASKPLPDIANMHLFGTHAVAVAPNQVAALPTTTLQLTLQGLFVNANAKESKALISAPGHAMRAYGPGDTVPGGATVYEILKDGVVLQRGSHLEKLTLPIKPVKFSPSPSQMNFQQGQQP